MLISYITRDTISELPNPYASPTVPHSVPGEFEHQQAVSPAGQGARLANYFIDYLAQFAISFLLGVVIVMVAGERGAAFISGTPGFLIGIPILLVYYFVLEATTSRTLGKLITGTKVVSHDGSPPTPGQIAGRTFCRLIPFEAFSFLGTPPKGWHDSIPKTLVVKTR